MSPDGTDNPYIWFSIGQIFFEEGNFEKAKPHFMSAYLLDGEGIFEDENPEYFGLINEDVKERLNTPNSNDEFRLSIPSAFFDYF